MQCIQQKKASSKDFHFVERALPQKQTVDWIVSKRKSQLFLTEHHEEELNKAKRSESEIPTTSSVRQERVWTCDYIHRLSQLHLKTQNELLKLWLEQENIWHSSLENDQNSFLSAGILIGQLNVPALIWPNVENKHLVCINCSCFDAIQLFVTPGNLCNFKFSSCALLL